MVVTCSSTIWYCTLRWRHNDHDGISNHQPHDCLLNPLFRRRSKKTSKLRVTGLCAGIHRWPVNSTHKWPVIRKMFPFDDVILRTAIMMVRWEHTVVAKSAIHVENTNSVDIQCVLWIMCGYSKSTWIFCILCSSATTYSIICMQTRTAGAIFRV